MKRLVLLATHVVALVMGFGLGVYFLPILTAPPAPDAATLDEMAAQSLYNSEVRRDLPGSDFLHWGQGEIRIGADMIVHRGKLSPGPDYKLYLVPTYADDEASFEAVKDQAVLVGDVKSFSGFALPVPEGVDVEAFTTVVVWCESFGEFITSAQYRP
ncbi:MAG: DM13 domain-containing protein [Pseudomonadota bacterium]